MAKAPHPLPPHGLWRSLWRIPCSLRFSRVSSGFFVFGVVFSRKIDKAVEMGEQMTGDAMNMGKGLQSQATKMGGSLKDKGMDAMNKAKSAGMGAVDKVKVAGQGLAAQGQNALSMFCSVVMSALNLLIPSSSTFSRPEATVSTTAFGRHSSHFFQKIERGNR